MRVVFVCSYPPTDMDKKRLSVSELNQKKISTSFLIVTNIIRPNNKIVTGDLDLVECKNIFDFAFQLEGCDPLNTVIVFDIGNDDNYLTRQLIKVASDLNLRYVRDCSLARVNLIKPPRGVLNKSVFVVKKLKQTLEQIYHHSKLTFMWRGIRRPERIIVPARSAGRQAARLYGNLFGLRNYYTCSHDFREARTLPTSATEFSPIVFLDEYIPFHPDWSDTPGLSEIMQSGAEEYYRKLKCFFEFLELKYGCNVIVCAHPRGDPKLQMELWKGFQVLFGQTARAIAKSRFCIAHASGAIDLAVSLGKPLVIVSVEELFDYLTYVNSVAALFDSSPLPVDYVNQYKVDQYLISGSSKGYQRWRTEKCSVYSNCEPPSSYDFLSSLLKSLK